MTNDESVCIINNSHRDPSVGSCPTAGQMVFQARLAKGRTVVVSPVTGIGLKTVVAP